MTGRRDTRKAAVEPLDVGAAVARKAVKGPVYVFTGADGAQWTVTFMQTHPERFDGAAIEAKGPDGNERAGSALWGVWHDPGKVDLGRGGNLYVAATLARKGEMAVWSVLRGESWDLPADVGDWVLGLWPSDQYLGWVWSGPGDFSGYKGGPVVWRGERPYSNQSTTGAASAGGAA